MTNYEKIKAMSIEEMAEWLEEIPVGCDFCPAREFCDMTPYGSCSITLQKWLESEVEENMLPEICSCGYWFVADETICPNCGNKVEEDG